MSDEKQVTNTQPANAPQAQPPIPPPPAAPKHHNQGLRGDTPAAPLARATTIQPGGESTTIDVTRSESTRVTTPWSQSAKHTVWAGRTPWYLQVQALRLENAALRAERDAAREDLETARRQFRAENAKAVAQLIKLRGEDDAPDTAAAGEALGEVAALQARVQELEAQLKRETEWAEQCQAQAQRAATRYERYAAEWVRGLRNKGVSDNEILDGMNRANKEGPDAPTAA